MDFNVDAPPIHTCSQSLPGFSGRQGLVDDCFGHDLTAKLVYYTSNKHVHTGMDRRGKFRINRQKNKDLCGFSQGPESDLSKPSHG
jgi:hypothetical protein